MSKLKALDDQLRQAVELDPVEFDVLRDTPVIGGGQVPSTFFLSLTW